ncbi:type II toxin-antitoxin system RelE/ParE family toxin [Candidatus Saccharibacteria bacterium]|nr:MAG: type II toxin-antitoxin system RelE/ParE family toxin [Candidatus Saccharibacteria bacterium]
MPTYEIKLSRLAVKTLKKLPSHISARIFQKIELLADDPRPAGVKKLTGYASFYRIRVGDYRVIYDIHDGRLTVLVVEVGHRKDIYR